jgi:hypothetical protein
MTKLENEYPSISLAYPIAVASLDLAAKRLDSVDGRLQTILAFIVTVSAAVPSIAAGRGAHFASVWFYGSLILFVACVALGTYARLAGTLKLLDPTNLYQNWLDITPIDFQKNLIFYAGQAFDSNIKLADWKWKCSVWITALFACEILALVAWVISAAVRS